MQITCKGCHFVILQGTMVQSGNPNCVVQSLPCDAELYIFQDLNFLTLQMLDYQNIMRKKKRIFSAKGLEVNISVGSGQFRQDSDSDQNSFLKRIILKWNEAQSRIEQFNNFYQQSIKIADLNNEILKLDQKNKTHEKIIEDLKKEMFRKTSRGLNSSEFHSCRGGDDTMDHSNILVELEQQFIKGQMKWAQIDMENATLNQQVQELTTQIHQLKKQVNHQGTNLLQSRQILGDILNLALEKGDHSILIKAGL